MARSSKSKKKAGIKLNFEGVESRSVHPEGRFPLVVDGAPELKTSENSGNDYLNWKLKSPKGTVYHMTSLAPHALWNLKNVLEAAGQEVPDGEMEIELDELDGLEFGGEVVHEKYQGENRARLGDVFPLDELEDGDKDDGEEEGDDDEPTYSEVQEMDKEELDELVEDKEIKIPAKTKKKLQAYRDAVCEELGLEDGEDEGDDLTADDINDLDKDELDELVEDKGLKIPAKAKKKLATYRDAVIEALELDSEDDEGQEEKSSKKTGKSKSAPKKGAKVSFEDDGETYEGKVKSVNEKDGFVVVVVDGEEWEVEIDDLL